MAKARNQPYSSIPNREPVPEDTGCKRACPVSDSQPETQLETDNRNDIVDVEDLSSGPDGIVFVRDSSSEPDDIIFLHERASSTREHHSLAAQVQQLTNTIRRNKAVVKRCKESIEETTLRSKKASKRIRSTKKALRILTTEQSPASNQSQQTVQRMAQQAVQQALRQTVRQEWRQEMQQEWRQEMRQEMRQAAQQAAQQVTQQAAQQAAKPMVHQAAEQTAQQTVQPVVQQTVQETAQELMIKPVEVSTPKPIQVSQQEPAQATAQKLVQQEPMQEKMQEPAQQAEQQQAVQSARPPTHHLDYNPARKSTRWLEKQPESILEPDSRLTRNDNDSSSAYKKRLVSEPYPTTKSSSLSLSDDSKEFPEICSSRVEYRVDSVKTLRRISYDYPPRRAIVHQFDNMDSETVVSYDSSRLQLLDPIEKETVAVWNGAAYRIPIEQVQPVSSSMLAIVSSSDSADQQASEAGRLFFMDVNEPAQDGHFSDLPIRTWASNTDANMNISVVEGVKSRGVGDDNRVSIFTGSLDEGLVYRRLFDISDGVVKELHKQQMFNEYRGRITGLCHIPGINTVVTGTTTGDIYLNNHESGKSLLGFRLTDNHTIGSIAGCPFNPHLFMVASHEPLGEILFYDTRRKAGNDLAVLAIDDFDNTITSRYCQPAWNPYDNLVYVPIQRDVDLKRVAAINVIDIRYTKHGFGAHFVLYEDEKDVFSVDFTRPTRNGDYQMITASERSIGFSSIKISKH